MSLTLYISQQDRVFAIERVVACLNALPEGHWQVDVKKHRRGRSVQQNRYLFGVCYELLSNHTGYSKDDIHTYVCGQVYGWKTVKCPRTPNSPNGVRDEPVRTTTRDEDGKHDVISWADFDDLTAFVQKLGSDAGVYIPDPDPELRKTA